MHLPPTLNLKNQNLNTAFNQSFVQSYNNLSSRSLKMGNFQHKSKQKRFENSFEDKQMNSYLHLPLVQERGIHKPRMDQNSLSKSRGLILGDNSQVKKKYEFGDEGVKVCEDVVQKYKASNYTIQRDMLQKFKREAQQFRRNRNTKGRNDPNNNKNFNQIKEGPFYKTNQLNTSIIQDNLSFVQMKRNQIEKKAQFQKEIQRRNYVIQRMRDQQELARKQKQARMQKQRRKKIKKQIYIKREKQNLIQVGNMLREIDQKIKKNSTQLQQNLKELRDQLSPKTQLAKVIKIVPNKFSQPLDQKDFQTYADQLLELNGSKSSKLPVVLYNNKYFDARTYFADYNNAPDKIDRTNSKNTAQDLQNIVKILKRNELRIKMLTQQTQFRE